MSKAFTDEEALTATVPGRRVERAAPGQERPISAAGHAVLLERADDLRRQLPGTTGEDRKQLEHRLALAEATLASVRVVASAAPDAAEVRFGSVVDLRWDDGRQQRLALVGPDELELLVVPGVTRMSVLSPLGRALLGQRVGDEVELERPRGPARAEVLRLA